MLSVDETSDKSAVLKNLVTRPIVINSYKELVPRMNDIFIKLVTEEE